MRTNRAKLRPLRRSPNAGRGGSETPGGMERSDAPRQVSVLDLPEPGAADHLGELALPRETPNALDKIAVGIAVAGYDLAQQWHDPKAVEVVKGLKKRRDGGGEFEAEKMATRLQHAARLGERSVDPGNVPQPETDRVEIDAALGHRKPFGVGAQPLDPGENSPVESASATYREHRFADIADGNASIGGLPARDEVRQGAQCDVTSAARHVEKTLTPTRLEPSHHL